MPGRPTDQYTQCLTCGQRQAAAAEDPYTDHDVWGYPPDLVPQSTWRDLTGPHIHKETR